MRGVGGDPPSALPPGQPVPAHGPGHPHDPVSAHDPAAHVADDRFGLQRHLQRMPDFSHMDQRVAGISFGGVLWRAKFTRPIQVSLAPNTLSIAP